ncbi:MAG: D-2-hydroxyacid dehydrogenase [Phycisphaerae bacterium]
MPALTIFTNHKFLDPTANAFLEEQIRARGHTLVVSRNLTTSNLSSAAADPTINDADVAFGQPDPGSLLTAPRLRWVQLTTAGYERYDRKDLRDALQCRAAVVSSSSSVYAMPVAEHALAMMLGLARQLPWALDEQRTTRAWSAAPMREKCKLLTGSTVLILSYGSIAKRLIELLAPFGCEIIAVRRNPKGDESVRVVGEDKVADVLPLADHVMNVLPGGPSTKHFVNAAFLAKTKPGAYFYNVGRGPTVDQDALLAALNSGHLGAAYLDVTDPEPLPKEHPLWSQPDCHITPHTAGGMHDEFHRIAKHFLTNLTRFEAGQEPLDRVI